MPELMERDLMHLDYHSLSDITVVQSLCSQRMSANKVIYCPKSQGAGLLLL